jgi:hypothetical protein
LGSENGHGGDASKAKPKPLHAEPVTQKVQHQKSADYKMAPVDNPQERLDQEFTTAFSSLKVPLPLPVFEGTKKKKLSACLAELSKNPREQPAMDESGFYQSFLKKIFDELSSYIQGTSQEKKPIYVCGGPGVGKTMGVTWACKEAFKSAGVEPTIAYINANILSEQRKPRLKFFQKLGTDLGMKEIRDIKEEDVTSKIEKHKTPFVVVIVDEVDLLVKKTGKPRLPRQPGNARESILSRLGEWSSEPNTRLAFIGISNCINDEKFDRIQALCPVSVPIIVIMPSHNVSYSHSSSACIIIFSGKCLSVQALLRI